MGGEGVDHGGAGATPLRGGGGGAARHTGLVGGAQGGAEGAHGVDLDRTLVDIAASGLTRLVDMIWTCVDVATTVVYLTVSVYWTAVAQRTVALYVNIVVGRVVDV